MKKQDQSLKNFGYKQELERTLTLKDLVIYGLIFMVPIAPFGIYGSVISSSKGMISLTYLIGIVAMLFTAVSYGQMSKAFPIAGSIYAYAQRGINKTTGFLSGWMIIMDYIFVPALLYVISANSLKSVLPAVSPYVWLVVYVVINTIINIRGIEFTATANKIFLIGELIVLAIFLACGLWGLTHSVGNGFTMKPFYDSKNFSMNFIFSALSVAVLSFLGFDGISTLAEETRGGNKVVGRAIIIALVVVGTLFVVQTYVAACLHPNYNSFGSLDNAFYEIAFSVGGKPLQYLTIFATILSWGIANALAAQAAITRILFGMARDRNLPHIFAVVHPKYKTPYISTLIVAGLSLIVGTIFMNNSGTLSAIVNCGALVSFCVIHVAVINYYIIRNHSKDYFKHLVVPVIGFAIIFFVLVNLDVLAKEMGICWFVVGCIYYAVLRFKRGKEENVDLNL